MPLMAHPESGRFNRPTPPEQTQLTREELQHLLEQNEENENLIERTRKRDELLELLDEIEDQK